MFEKLSYMHVGMRHIMCRTHVTRRSNCLLQWHTNSADVSSNYFDMQLGIIYRLFLLQSARLRNKRNMRQYFEFQYLC